MVEVDGAEGVEDGLALAVEGGVGDGDEFAILDGRVVEGGGDGAFALEEFGVGSGVIDEADGVGVCFEFFCHILLSIIKNSKFVGLEY